MAGILTERLGEVKKEIPERSFWDGYKWAKIKEVRRIVIPMECRHNGSTDTPKRMLFNT